MEPQESTPLLDPKEIMYDGTPRKFLVPHLRLVYSPPRELPIVLTLHKPAAPFATALVTPVENGTAADEKPLRLPQAIAHRGYKAAFPENTMAAFRSAVEIGAHAVETDVHLSKDGVVVLSHVSFL